MYRRDATIDDVLAAFPRIPVPVLDSLKRIEGSMFTPLPPDFRYPIRCRCGYVFKAKVSVCFQPRTAAADPGDRYSFSHESDCRACQLEASARAHRYAAEKKDRQAADARARQRKRKAATP